MGSRGTAADVGVGVGAGASVELHSSLVHHELELELILITKTKKGIHKKSIIPVRFVPMVHPSDPIPDK